MLCSTTNRRPRPQSAASASGPTPQTTTGPKIELVGTWDYKWPRDSVIRIAFQDPREPVCDPAGLADAKRSIIEKASKWGVTVKCPEGNVDPPEAVPLTLVFLPEPVSRTSPVVVEYDVLISLQPMPFVLPAGLDRAADETVFLTQSQLGTYARRSDYGIPTTWLGPPATSDGSNPFLFYETPEGQHAILHEIGHMLGLAHAHQSPLIEPPEWKSNDECVAIMKAVLGSRLQHLDQPGKIEVERRLPELIESQVRLAWRGAPEFSDWPERAAVDAESVMIYGSYHCMLAGSADCSSADCPCLAFHVGPSAEDMRWLRGLYDRALLAPGGAVHEVGGPAVAPQIASTTPPPPRGGTNVNLPGTASRPRKNPTPGSMDGSN